MLFDSIEWDDGNLERACRRATEEEIEPVIMNADTWRRHRVFADRVLITAETNGGRRPSIVARYDAGRHAVRPITAWEDK